MLVPRTPYLFCPGLSDKPVVLALLLRRIDDLRKI